MLTKKEIIDIFDNGTEEEQLEIVYKTHYQDGWAHFDNFWSDKDVALTEFNRCVLDGYKAEYAVENNYLIPAKAKHYIADYDLDAYNQWHFMEGDAFIRKSDELDLPDGHIYTYSAGFQKLSFDIKHTRRPVVVDKESNCLSGPGVCYKKTHNADLIFLYKTPERYLYIYYLMSNKANLVLEESL